MDPVEEIVVVHSLVKIKNLKVAACMPVVTP
jgi:hypothetical protein